MIPFLIGAAVLVAIGLAFVLPPLLRAQRSDAHADRDRTDRAQANLGILRNQLAELEAEHRRGALSDAQYAETKAELERRVLDDVAVDAVDAVVDSPTAAASPTGVRISAAVLAVCVPIAAGLLYTRLGDPKAFDPLVQAVAKVNSEANNGEITPEQVEKMVADLAARLEKEPENGDGWAALARAYFQLERLPDALRAFEKAVALKPQDADALVDYADALAVNDNRKISGKSLELVQRALAVNPKQWKALAMAGSAAFERKEFSEAAGYWERLLQVLPANADFARDVEMSVAEARKLAGENPSKVPAGKSEAKKDDAKKSEAAEAAVSGTVALSAELKAKTAPTDTVFIFARPAQGPRMPLAVMRVQVKDLPAKFSLTDAMAMSPNFKLSSFSDVIVGARVSKSGQAGAQSGDLEGLSGTVRLGARDIAVVIDSVVP